MPMNWKGKKGVEPREAKARKESGGLGIQSGVLSDGPAGHGGMKRNKHSNKSSGEKAVWNTPNPKPKSKRTSLSSSQKASAKASAKAAGRPYPNLVDNMRAAKK